MCESRREKKKEVEECDMRECNNERLKDSHTSDDESFSSVEISCMFTTISISQPYFMNVFFRNDRVHT